MSAPTDAERVFAYHRRTKHHLQRYARGPGYLDWETQPDPFRTFAGAPRTALPLTANGVETRYSDLYVARAVDPRPLGLESIGAFFELALGLTAWKEYEGSRWALRSDPSSGNLHPTEGYAVLPELDEVAAGVHHYLSRDHVLEHRCRLGPGPAAELGRWLAPGGFLVGVSSIHWREAWKYGERAFRYCQHDVGHVIATLRFAAAALGWSVRLLDGFGDAHVGASLGLDRDADFAAVDAQDREHPDAVLLVAPPEHASLAEELERDAGGIARLLARGSWSGSANMLSPEHVEWDVIDAVAEATRKPPSRSSFAIEGASWNVLAPDCEAPAATIIRQRRSAVALDRVTSISHRQLYAMLERLLPRRGEAPWDILPWAPKLHLGLFVHRVDGLAPGLYLFERTTDVHERFVEELGDGPSWSRPPECPEHLRLYCLREVDCRRAAAAVSCHQDIAADGAFSLGMVAEFRAPIESCAAWYRRLFWESGVIGQVLYLEAEAIGLRGTGIGCYFDDAFHEVLGLSGDRFQSLYHFTMGGAVEDSRLVTHPPYEHL